MKPFIILLLLMSVQCFAQQSDSLRFLEFIPLYSNRLGDMPYENQLNANKTLVFDNAYVSDLEPLKQSFYTIGLISKWYSHINTKALLSFEMGYAYSQYTGSLKYKLNYYAPGPYNIPMVGTEEIKSHRGTLKIGIAGFYQPDAKRRIAVMPDFLFGFDFDSHNGKAVQESNEEYGYYNAYPSFDQFRLRLGGQLDVKVNYRLNEYMGFGLTLRNLVGAYAVSKTDFAYAEPIESEYAEISIGKMNMPQLSLIVYLKPKKR